MFLNLNKKNKKNKMKTIKITLLLFFLITGVLKAQIVNDDISFSVKGLSNEYSIRFKENIGVFIKTLNQLKVTSSIVPIKISVIYENGEGLVDAIINYNNNEIFSEYSDYTRHNEQYNKFGEGTSLWLQNQIFTALSSYKKSVATKGYMMDKDLLNFKSCITYKKVNGDWMKFYAYNYIDSDRLYPQVINNIVSFFIAGKSYEIKSANLEALNKYYYFYVGKKIGLDGKKTGAYYFCNFFNSSTEKTFYKKEKEVKNEIIDSNIKNDLIKLKLKGKVKSITLTKTYVNPKYKHLNSKETILFNKKGVKIEKKSLEYEVKKEYDEQGNMIEENTYSKDGLLISKNKYDYDEKRNIIEFNCIIDVNMDYKNKVTYKYDDRGNMIEEISDFDNFTKSTYQYDERGNKVEEKKQHSPTNSWDEKIIYKYDERGNVIEESWYKSDESLDHKITYKYIYDIKGNWINQKEIKNGIVDIIIKRVILYY